LANAFLPFSAKGETRRGRLFDRLFDFSLQTSKRNANYMKNPFPERAVNSESTTNAERIFFLVSGFLAAYLSFLFFVQAFFSLRWRMAHDFPLLQYVNFLVTEKGFILYKNVFETSFPGTFLFHLFAAKVFGYGDFAMRILDILVLSGISAMIFLVLRDFGKLCGFIGAALFGACYLELGPKMSLQRDFIAILPIAIATWLTFEHSEKRPVKVGFALGFLFGLAASIKPQFALGLPVLLLYLRKFASSSFVQMFFSVGTGIFASFLIIFFYFVRYCSFDAFSEMVRHYLPLHVAITGDFRLLEDWDRFNYLFRSYLEFGMRPLWLVPTISGWLGIALEKNFAPTLKRKVDFIGILLISYSFLPIFGGKFWSYHWLPFFFFASILSALNLAPRQEQKKGLVFLFLLALPIVEDVKPSEEFLQQIKGSSYPVQNLKRTDEIADFLAKRLKPNDSVQPLDWTGGVIHGMLIAKAKIATPFLYDYHFYHNISNPFIKTIRRRFLERLGEEKPRFIIQAVTDRPWLTGPDTTIDFSELRNFIRKNYNLAFSGDGYNIFEIKPGG